MLTDRDLQALVRAGKGREVSIDHPGAFIRIGPRRSTFFLRYRWGGRQRSMRLGVYGVLPGEISLAEGRRRAAIARGELLQGRNPNGPLEDVRPRRTLTVAEVVKAYTDRHCARLKTGQDVARLLQNHVVPALGELPAGNLHRAHALELLDQLRERPVLANRVRAWLKGCTSWAVGAGLLDSDPLVGLKGRNKEKARDVILSSDQLAEVWHACPDGVTGVGIRLAILTGQRRESIARLSWADLDLESARWHLPEIKGWSHTLPLARQAVELIAELRGFDPDWVLPGQRDGSHIRADSLTQAFRRIAAQVGASVTLHDVRRTFRTGLAELGCPGEIAELLIAHKPQGIRAVYDVYSYMEPMARWVEIWGRHVARLVGEEAREGTVVDFPGHG